MCLLCGAASHTLFAVVWTSAESTDDGVGGRCLYWTVAPGVDSAPERFGPLMQMVKTLRRGVAVVSATALACTPLLLAPSGATASPAPTTSRAAMPHITATLTKKTIRIAGADGLRPGRVKLSVKGNGSSSSRSSGAGYDAADFTADINTFGAKNDIKALKRAWPTPRSWAASRVAASGTVVLPERRRVHAVLHRRPRRRRRRPVVVTRARRGRRRPRRPTAGSSPRPVPRGAVRRRCRPRAGSSSRTRATRASRTS